MVEGVGTAFEKNFKIPSFFTISKLLSSSDGTDESSEDSSDDIVVVWLLVDVLVSELRTKMKSDANYGSSKLAVRLGHFRRICGVRLQGTQGHNLQHSTNACFDRDFSIST